MRSHSNLVGLTLVIFGCAASEPSAVPEQPAPEAEDAFLVSGYHPYWMQDTWTAYEPSVYDEIYFFSIDIDSSGQIADRHGWPDRWFTMQQELSGRSIRVTPVVTLFSQSGFERLFAEPETSDELLETLVDLLRDSPSAGGLQLDFEIYQPVAAEVRRNFTAFVERLREDIRAVRPDSRLSLYMLAYDQSDVFDEEALQEHVDYFIVQGYDLFGRNEGRTGPVAGLEGWGNRNWKSIVKRLRSLGVEGDKIVMSVPYFGYEWPAESDEPGAATTGSGVTLSYAPVDSSLVPGTGRSARAEAEKHGLRRDPASGSPYFAYRDSTGWRQGWFEDAESLRRKYAYVKEAGLRGVAVFPAAYGAEELTAVLREAFGNDGM